MTGAAAKAISFRSPVKTRPECRAGNYKLSNCDVIVVRCSYEDFTQLPKREGGERSRGESAMMRSVMGRPGLRLRAGLAQVQARGLAIPGVRPADGEGQDWIVFPRERQGRDYSLNHSLNRQSIVPIGDAFLNPSVSMLSSKLGIKAGAGGGNSLKVAGPDPAAPVHPLLEAGTAELSFDAYDDIAEAAQGHLSSGVDIYVADGTAGSYRGARVGVRIITDDPAVCMAARSLLVPSPVVKYENADTPLSPIVAYVTSAGLKASVIQYSENESGALCGASIVLSGAAAASQGTLAAAIEKVARSVLAESELVTILPATTLRKGSKTALYFGAG
jgi:hypothetical protein